MLKVQRTLWKTGILQFIFWTTSFRDLSQLITYSRTGLFWVSQPSTAKSLRLSCDVVSICCRIAIRVEWGIPGTSLSAIARKSAKYDNALAYSPCPVSPTSFLLNTMFAIPATIPRYTYLTSQSHFGLSAHNARLLSIVNEHRKVVPLYPALPSISLWSLALRDPPQCLGRMWERW
jgi:hypothetical protein